MATRPYLISPQQLILLVLEVVKDCQELLNAMCTNMICVLLRVVPVERGAVGKKTHVFAAVGGEVEGGEVEGGWVDDKFCSAISAPWLHDDSTKPPSVLGLRCWLTPRFVHNAQNGLLAKPDPTRAACRGHSDRSATGKSIPPAIVFAPSVGLWLDCCPYVCHGQVIDYDRKRNSNREALHQMKNKLAKDSKLWVNIGDMFIKLPKENTRTMIQKDQQNLDKEISTLRDKLKDKAQELERIEGKDGKRVAGFKLKAMTTDELYNIRRRPKEVGEEDEE
ncbi:hypothetical protein BC938DRAFT_476884 [Jimgerdemannia flammicorona]|uniref:p53 and DNA damage-regulated protein 1 n=1 Tax=Jimgerdemannia flammicorona TaxID=994334 RepID=A0A433QQ04_9FUNG|nr:hypothetical protein BC938DRAFT_476884 [Jimgerdemannia flammicorona]